MTTKQESDAVPAAFMLPLSKEKTLVLWQLLNTQGAGTTFAAAHVAAGLYEDIRRAAVFHGLVAP